MVVEVINLYVNETTEARTSLTKSLKFQNYSRIDKLWIDAILTAPSGILSTGWKLDKFLFNGRGTSVNSTALNLKMYDSKVIGQNPPELNEDNIVSVSWIAPLGAGVISPHANITIKVRVDGQKIVPGIDSELLENLNPSNIAGSLDLFTDRSTIPVLITIIIIIALIIIGILLLPRILIAREISKNV